VVLAAFSDGPILCLRVFPWVWCPGFRPRRASGERVMMRLAGWSCRPWWIPWRSCGAPETV